MIEADRILEGLSRTLEESVLPALGNGFARGQLFAVLEVLGGLQGQLGWGGMLLENEAASLASLLEDASKSTGGTLGERLRGYAALASAPLDDRLREGRALVCALIEEGHADDGELALAVDAFLANDTIFKAMALRPSRLAEISQG
jgi:hypothetical protein